MQTKELLTKIGLDKKESQIYTALLEHGPLSISDICKYTKLHRPAVYNHIPHLVEQQLVAEIQHGKRIRFSAESPDKLLTLIHNIEHTLESQLPELQSIYSAVGKRPIVKYYEGAKGITFVLNDLVQTLKKGDIYYRYTSVKDALKTEKYLPRDYRYVRDQKQLERYVITNRLVASQKKKRLGREIKIVPEKYGLFDYNISHIVYGNKMAYIDYTTEAGIIIENEAMATYQKKLYKILFDLLPGTNH